MGLTNPLLTTISVSKVFRDYIKHRTRRDQSYQDVLEEWARSFEERNQKEEVGARPAQTRVLQTDNTNANTPDLKEVER